MLLLSEGQTGGAWEPSEECSFGKVRVGPNLSFQDASVSLDLKQKLNWSTKSIRANNIS